MAEQKTGTCTEVIFKKTGTGQYGEYHIFTVSFKDANGVVTGGDYMAKSNPQKAFEVGKQYSYEYEEVVNGQYTNKKVKPSQNQPGAKQFYPKKSTAAESAIIAASNVASLGTPEDVIKTADSFLTWIKAHE